jgi:ribose transport system substrate-binding protein
MSKAPAPIALITKNQTNPAYGGALIGARTVAKRYGASIRYYAPVVPDNVTEQVQLVERAIREHPAAIILLPAHESGVNAAIDKIERAGIPLVLIVSKPSAGHWISYISADNYRLCTNLAQRLFVQLNGAGNVAIMDGHPDSITTPDRHRGFVDAAAGCAGIRIVESCSGYYQHDPARDAARGLLARHSALDGMLIANDLMAMGVIDALDQSGRQLSLVSVNGTPEAVAAIKAGRLVASACFNTLSFGCLAVEAAMRHLNGEKIPSEIIVPADIIDLGNVNEWDLPYEARPLPSWDQVVASQ